MSHSKKASSPAPANRGSRDAEATKLQILDAAEFEFAAQGLYGTRVDAISKRADVSPRMIYYYFENKEGLYQAVLQRPVALLHSIFLELDLDQRSPRAGACYLNSRGDSVRNI